MLFTPDTRVALEAAAALINTGPSPREPQRELLPQVAALTAFVEHWGWTGAHRRDQAELDEVRSVRARLRGLWESGDPTEDAGHAGAAAREVAVVALVNALLAETQALPQLTRHDDVGWHVHATPLDAPLSERMVVEAAVAMTDVLRQEELGRLRTCASPGCNDVHVDLSRNRSRRTCSTACANRTHVAAYRARRTGASGAASG